MINLNKENEGSWSNGSEENNSIDVNIGTTTTTRTSSGDSPFYSNNNKNNVFPESSPIPLAQLFHQSSSRSDLQCHKIDPTVPDDQGFCNMFATPVDDQTNFWPWPEQQQFN